MILPTARLLWLFLAGLPLAALAGWGGAAGAFPWLVLVLVLLGGMTVDVLAGPTRGRVRVDADLPREIPVGRTHPAPLTLHGGLRPVRVKIRAEVDARIRRPADLDVVVGREPVHATLPLATLLRGPATVHELWLQWTGPLGLAKRIVRRPLDHTLHIVPDLGPVRGMAVQAALSRHQVGLKVERYVGDGTEFEALREYVPGYDPRAMDWRATARHRTLICREYRAERNQSIVLGIDTGRLMREEVQGAPKLDRAITAALSLAWLGLQTGDRVGLFAFDARVRAWEPPRGGQEMYRRLVHTAAGLDYQTHETNFTLGITALRQRLNRRGLVVILTDFVDSITAELMLENVQRLAKRQLVLFVAIQDPDLHALAERAPQRLTGMYESVVAEEMLKERRKVFRRLQRAGVLCLDVPPLDASGRIMNRYLDLKRRERIG